MLKSYKRVLIDYLERVVTNFKHEVKDRQQISHELTLERPEAQARQKYFIGIVFSQNMYQHILAFCSWARIQMTRLACTVGPLLTS